MGSHVAVVCSRSDTKSIAEFLCVDFLNLARGDAHQQIGSHRECTAHLQRDGAFFYARANKVGTVVDQNDGLCVEGRRKPAWTSASNTYAVKGAWLDKLLRAYKLSLSVY